MIVKILIGLGAVIGVLLIIAAFTKKEYTVQRNITINKLNSAVFHFIKYLKNQDSYSKWAMMDPEMKKEYRGTDGTPGFMYTWDSENKSAGKGEQEIRSVIEDKEVTYNLHFIKPFEGFANARMNTEALSQNETKVTWRFDGKMAYPTNLTLLFMNMDKVIGNDLETGLANLKTLLEKNDLAHNQNQ